MTRQTYHAGGVDARASGELKRFFRFSGADWIKVVTGTIASVIISVALAVPIGKAHPWLPWVVFIVIWSFTWVWAFFRTWRREYHRAENIKAELSAYHLDLVVAWIKYKKLGGFSCAQIAEDLQLPEEDVLSALHLLRDKFGAVSQSGAHWRFDSERGTQVNPKVFPAALVWSMVAQAKQQ